MYVWWVLVLIFILFLFPLKEFSVTEVDFSDSCIEKPETLLCVSQHMYIIWFFKNFVALFFFS